ncbi:hypothetical protein AVENLUH7437_00617 [Acinetobacter venetianus]|nr:hypothetical protein AVENLUH7437_00617 [Acinetobacter venetianus]
MLAASGLNFGLGIGFGFGVLVYVHTGGNDYNPESMIKRKSVDLIIVWPYF